MFIFQSQQIKCGFLLNKRCDGDSRFIDLCAVMSEHILKDKAQNVSLSTRVHVLTCVTQCHFLPVWSQVVVFAIIFNVCFQSFIFPGHNCFELAQLSVYAFHDGAMELLSDGMFNFIPDSTFFLAQFLAGSVRDVNALDDPSSLKTDQFNLWSEDMSTLDERLACAFEHLELPPSWRLVEDSSRLDQGECYIWCPV